MIEIFNEIFLVSNHWVHGVLELYHGNFIFCVIFLQRFLKIPDFLLNLFTDAQIWLHCHEYYVFVLVQQNFVQNIYYGLLKIILVVNVLKYFFSHPLANYWKFPHHPNELVELLIRSIVLVDFIKLKFLVLIFRNQNWSVVFSHFEGVIAA